MQRRQLGRTGALLPSIGQGTTGTGAYSSVDEDRDRRRVALLCAGIEQGLNFIDTAELYGGGHGEEIAGRAITGIRERVFLASKFNPSNNTSAGIEKALEGSLRRLGTDYLDLYQVHWPNPFIPLEETLGCLTRQVEKGKIRYIGLSNFSLPELQEACLIADIASVQLEYNLVERGIEAEMLPFCERNGITVLAYSPLDRGRRLRNSHILDRLAEKYGCSSSQIVLNWITRSESIIAVTMTTSMTHMREYPGVGDFKLAAADIRALSDATRCPVERIAPVDIEIVSGSRPVHLTMEQARENVADLVPHPVELAESLRRYNIEKPIRVVRNKVGSSPKRFTLVDEHLRFWAWVIAYGWERPVPAYVLS